MLQQVKQAAIPGTQSHLTATASTTGCSNRDSDSPHCYSWYNRLQYQGLSLISLLQLVQQSALPTTHTHLTATAGTTGCSTRDSTSPHSYSWYNRLQYQGLSLISLLQLVKQAAVPGTQSHLTATAGKTGCSTRVSASSHCYGW